MQLKVEVTGEVLERLAKGDVFVKGEMRGLMKETSGRGRQHMIAEVPKDQGSLQQSIVAEAYETKAYVYPSQSHAEWVQKGTRPHTAPFAPIKKWAERRGLPPGAVWHSIRRKGTKPNKFIDRTTDKLKKDVPGMVNKMANRIADYIRGN